MSTHSRRCQQCVSARGQGLIESRHVLAHRAFLVAHTDDFLRTVSASGMPSVHVAYCPIAHVLAYDMRADIERCAGQRAACLELHRGGAVAMHCTSAREMIISLSCCLKI